MLEHEASLEAEVVGSRGEPFWLRWRTGQQFSCGEPFDDMHRATADGTVPVGGRAGMIDRVYVVGGGTLAALASIRKQSGSN